MKHVMFVAMAGIALVGCHNSPSSQFAAMCKHMKADDPEHYAVTEGACSNADNIPDAQKAELIAAYKELQKAESAVEAPR